MSHTPALPFEREPQSYMEQGSLVELLGNIGQMDVLLCEDDSNYWKAIAARRMGKLGLEGMDSGRPVGTRYWMRDRKWPWGRAGAYLSVLGETVEFPADSSAPIAVASWFAYLDDKTESGEAYGALMLGSHELFIAPQTTQPGSIGVVIGLEIYSHQPTAHGLPDGVEYLWDELELASLLPCPEQAPLPYAEFDGQPRHIRALSRFMLGS